MSDPETRPGALQRQNLGGNGSARPEERPGAGLAQQVTVPCDVYENDNGYLIVADMPGLGADACDLHVRGDRLELRGERLIGEQRVVYERNFAMPQNADTKDISATYRDGVVRVVVAKTQESRPRRIPVHA